MPGVEINSASVCLVLRMQVEAQLLAGAKLAEGVKQAHTGGSGWINHVPICSGQAYNVSDGKPYNPQRMMDDIFERLGEQHTSQRQTASGHLPTGSSKSPANL